MELKDFIQTTLIDVAEGIEAAQLHDRVGGQIAPSGHGGHDFPVDKGVASNSRIMSTVIQFDVAITSTNSIAGEANSKGRILVAEASGKIEGEHTSSKATRIQFSVPFIFSPNKKNWHE